MTRHHRNRQLDHLSLGLAALRHSGPREAYVPLFGAFGAARDDATVARWSANSLGIL